MKNSFLFITAGGIFLASTFSSVNAQGFDIGLRVGMNLSYYHQNSFNPPPYRSAPEIVPGFAGGVQGDYWFNSAWAISWQILYARKQEKFANVIYGTGNAGIPVSTSTHSYIEIPLEVKRSFRAYASLRPYMFAGITVGFLSSERGVLIYGFSKDGPLVFSTLDVGVIGGVGFNYVIPTGVSAFGSGTSMFIDAGYRVGLINLNNTVNGSTVNDLRFSAGILFPM